MMVYILQYSNIFYFSLVIDLSIDLIVGVLVGELFVIGDQL